MKTVFWLLVLLVCLVAYVRAQRPATWNSWMVACGANNLVVAATPGAAGAPGDSSAPADAGVPTAPSGLAPAPPPPRTIPVGGMINDGNFTFGAKYWDGDGQADPSGKGLAVTLSPSSWTRVYQAFPSGAGTLYSIEVTYRFSPGLTVSKNPADYANISKRLQISGFENFGSLGVPPGDFYGTIGDPSTPRITCEVYTPQYGSTAIQDYQHTYATIPPNGDKTFALAFPPGTGTVTLLTAYVTSR